MRYRIVLGYDGTSYCGWQSQPNGESVQDAVEAAAERLFGTKPRVVGSGRTDAGVHALGQVAHFDCEKILPEKSVVGGLNAYLPNTVRVHECEYVSESFDARKSAKKKTYMYLMYTGRVQPVLSTRAVNVGELDIGAMNAAAQAVVGTHDFASFKAAGSNAKTSTRTVISASVTRNGDFIKFEITANGFLYNMVRIIAAQLIKIGGGADVDMPALIAAKDRTLAKETAPACGLYLVNVDYSEQKI